MTATIIKDPTAFKATHSHHLGGSSKINGIFWELLRNKATHSHHLGRLAQEDVASAPPVTVSATGIFYYFTSGWSALKTDFERLFYYFTIFLFYYFKSDWSALRKVFNRLFFIILLFYFFTSGTSGEF